jgi:hypothetical protein
MVLVGKPNRFTTSAEMRFFWLPLSTMNYSEEPFTHNWEWKWRSSSSGSSGSSFFIFVVETVGDGSHSWIASRSRARRPSVLCHGLFIDGVTEWKPTQNDIIPTPN